MRGNTKKLMEKERRGRGEGGEVGEKEEEE